MKKLWLFLVLFVLMFSVVYAERGSDDSGTSGNDDAPECSVDSDCGEGFVCDTRGECEDLNDDSGNDDSTSGNDDSCSVDSDCDSDELCIAGECDDSFDDSDNSTRDDECVIDANCSNGKVCLNGDCEDVDDDLSDDSSSNDSDDSTDRSRWLKECVDESAVKNMNDLMLKLRSADKTGDAEKVADLKLKIRELSGKIKERADNCARMRNVNLGLAVSSAVKANDGNAADIVAHYKSRLSDIAMEDNDSTKIEMLKLLRSEIDGQIRSLMERKREIRQDDMKDLVERIEVRRDKIRADDVEVDSENKSIITEINGKEVEIKVLNGQVKIVVDGVEVDTSDIVIENNTLYYDGVAIKTLPSDALFRYKIKAMAMELEQKDDKLVYKVKYVEDKKIFGLFKAKAERVANIDSADGNKLDDNGPWWNFLATDDKAADATDVDSTSD